MALRTAYREISDGVRIPYQARGAENRGFVDLRGQPEAAATIAEAAGSTALRTLLVRLATPGSTVFSLGCDLGMHRAEAAPPQRRHVAGGYLHLIAAAYERISAPAYHAFAQSLETAVSAGARQRNWELAFLLQAVEMRLDGSEPCRCPSLGVRFYASAPNAAAALHSREALIAALDGSLARPAVLWALGN